MPRGILPAPGTEHGPCLRRGDPMMDGSDDCFEGTGECGHFSCALIRTMAETACQVCGEPIGYELWYLSRGSHQDLVHAACDKSGSLDLGPLRPCKECGEMNPASLLSDLETCCRCDKEKDE